MIADEVSGDGMIIIDGENVEIVSYWLTVVPKAGLVIAEGSISGSEEVMKKVKNAKTAKLMLVDGPTVALRCHGGRSGMRWVKAMRAGSEQHPEIGRGRPQKMRTCTSD
jgi:hypothetical protein